MKSPKRADTGTCLLSREEEINVGFTKDPGALESLLKEWLGLQIVMKESK